MTWVGFPVAIAVALLVVPAGCAACSTPAWCGELPRRRARLPARRGAGDGGAGRARAARLPRRPRRPRPARPELRRWLPYLLGVAFLGFLDDSLGAGERADTPRGWRGHARALREGALSTGAIKAIGALALAAYVVSGAGLESWRYLADVALLILATNAFNLLDLRPGTGGKGLALLGAGSASAPGPSPDRPARHLRRTDPGRRLVHPARAGDAGRHRSNRWLPSAASGC
jgi:hypothetical protein